LTKHEAAELISKFRGEPKEETKPVAPRPPQTASAYQFRLSIQASPEPRDERSPHEFAKEERLEFWLSTCRGTTRIQSASCRVLELYRKHGCLFCEPTPRQIQDILDALDTAMPRWDKDHPELFYQALRLNFPELVRHQ
jgi:hypothetical protein